MKHFDPDKHTKQPPAGVASEELSHQLPVPQESSEPPGATSICSYKKKKMEIGAVKLSKGL